MTCADKGASFSRTILKVLRLGERLRHLPWRDHPPPGAVARVEEFPAAGVANLEAPGVHSAEHSNWKSSRHFWVATWSCSTHGGAVRFGVSLQFDRFQPGGWTNSNSAGPGSAQPGSAVLNSVGLPVTYSTQSSRIIRCTSSALKPIPLGCLLPS
jgi:hypothetical protein